MFRRTIAKMACAPNEYIGASGSRYRFKELLQERPSMGRVWLAKSDFLHLHHWQSQLISVDADKISLS